MIDRLEKEYREFGPWILEIKSQEDVPDLFRRQYTFDSSVVCALKIPVPMDRRQAKKGMDFYRSVISFNRDEIQILEKSWTEINIKKISYINIRALKNMIDLLEAELTIYTEEENYSVRYSSVSEDIINNVIAIIRGRYLQNSESCRIMTEYKGEITDQLFRNLINISGEKEHLIPVNFQKSVPARKENMKLKDYIMLNYRFELQSYIFMRTEKELVAVNRNKGIRKKREVDYSYNYTFIPFSNIESVEFIPDPEFKEIYILNIKPGKALSLSFPVSKETINDFSEISDIYSY